MYNVVILLEALLFLYVQCGHFAQCSVVPLCTMWSFCTMLCCSFMYNVVILLEGPLLLLCIQWAFSFSVEVLAPLHVHCMGIS